jgi:acetylornithine/N-succinyldiaminopimelate aminotransferase
MVSRLMAARLLTVGAGDNVVRLLPPLIVEPAQIDEAAGIIDSVCRDWPEVH